MEFKIQFQDADFNKPVNAIRFIIANKNRVLIFLQKSVAAKKKIIIIIL